MWVIDDMVQSALFVLTWGFFNYISDCVGNAILAFYKLNTNFVENNFMSVMGSFDREPIIVMTK